MQGARWALRPGDHFPAGMSSVGRDCALLHTPFSVTLGEGPQCSEQGNGDNNMPLELQGGVINPKICNRPSPEPGRWMVSDRGGSLLPTAGQDAPAGVTAPTSCFWDLCLAPLAPGCETLGKPLPLS